MRALSIGLFLLVASHAAARPAVVRIFEAKARSNPSTGSKVVAVFIEGQRLSVSESAKGGWRQVRLADGTTAWVQEEALFLDAQLPEGAAKPNAATPNAATPNTVTPYSPAQRGAPRFTPSAPITPPMEHPFKLVASLDDLREAVNTEPPLLQQVEVLERDARTSRWIFFGGIAAGVLMAGVPLTINSLNGEHTAGGWMYGGGGILLTTQLASWAYTVGEEEMAPVINTWNEGHPKATLQYREP